MHVVINLIRFRRAPCVRSKVERISVEVVKRHRSVSSMSKVSSDRLRQPSRLNKDSASGIWGVAAARFGGQ